MMRVAITGASGYVGSRIMDSFRGRGHEPLPWSRRHCAGNWHHYELGADPGSLPWNGVDALIHTSYDFDPISWDTIYKKNVVGSIALLEAAAEAGVSKLVFISSISSFDGTCSNYGKAKLMIEKAALEMGAAVIRPGLVWGNRSGGVMGALEKLVKRLPVIPYLCGRGGLKQYLVHEEDMSDAVVTITENHLASTGAIHDVAHPTPVSLISILNVIAARADTPRLFIPVPWQFAMLGLTTAEKFGLRPMFRSDSLRGLVHIASELKQNLPPEGIKYRPFE